MMLIPHCISQHKITERHRQARTYHLLSDHDNEAGQSGAPDARNREELGEAREVVGLPHDARLNL